MTNRVLQELKPRVDETISSLRRKVFKADPIAGDYYSKIVSLMSSAYKRHGNILEAAILEALKAKPGVEVWRDAKFPVTQSADQMVAAALRNPKLIEGVNLPQGQAIRTLQVDLFVYNKESRTLDAYEIKRGHGRHDAGKQRSMITDVMCTQVLLQSYGRGRWCNPETVRSQIIFYYGECSVGAPWAVKGKDLDRHFGYPVYDSIESVNAYYRQSLQEMLSGGK